MTKHVYRLKTKHRVWSVEIYDRPDAIHMLATAKGKWVFEEEIQAIEWIGEVVKNFPYKTKPIISTWGHSKETIIHHPDGMIVRERPGLPTEVTFATPE